MPRSFGLTCSASLANSARAASLSGLGQRGLLLFGLLLIGPGLLAAAGILPEGIDQHSRTKVGPAPALPQISAPVLKEYGLEESEQATYEGKKATFSVAAWRFLDPTGAYAAFLAIRPAGAPSPLAKYSALAGNQLWLLRGNYIVRFDGYQPVEDTWMQLLLHVPRLSQASLPSLPGFVPADGLVESSLRYITGPESLAAVAPSISPSLAAFQFSTEAIASRHTDPAGPVEMVILSYPSPQIAQKQLEAFQAQAGLLAARSSSLITVVTKAPTPDVAQRWVTKVKYQANLSVNLSKPPDTPADFADMILGIGKLIGILLAMCLIGGGAFAAIRMRSGARLGSLAEGNDEVTTLKLDTK